MAFDFKKDSANNGGGFVSPFEEETAQSTKKEPAGFSFGNAGVGRSKSEKRSSGGFSSGGFDFPGTQKKSTSGAGFLDLPTDGAGHNSMQDYSTNRAPKGLDIPGGRQHRSRSGFDASGIPWRAIIYFVLILTSVVLLITYWDVILNVLYNLIAILIVVVILVIVLKLLLRPRR